MKPKSHDCTILRHLNVFPILGTCNMSKQHACGFYRVSGLGFGGEDTGS